MSHIDQQAYGYWRARTINEAQLQGYRVVRLTCECGRITDYPLALLLQRRGVTRYRFLGNMPFKCKKCGAAKPQIGMQRHRENNKSAR